MKLKRNALIAVFAAATMLGVVGCDKHSNTNQAPAAQTQTQTTQTQTAPAPVAVTPATPAQPASGPNHRDTPEEKAAKLSAMERGDLAVLSAMGWTPNARTGMGRCNADGYTVDGSGWHGTSTAIEYDISKAGNAQHYEVCVSHQGGKPNVGTPHMTP